MAPEVKTAGLMNAFIEKHRVKRGQHIRKRAREFGEVVKDEHRTAARGGAGINMFGEPRSAPGEPPAMETGSLFAQIDQGVDADVRKREARVIANYKVLEDGTRRMEPRPLGRIALAKYRGRVR